MIDISEGVISSNGGVVVKDVRSLQTLQIDMAFLVATSCTFAFEYSNNSTDGVNGNWKSLLGCRSNANTIEASTGALAATPAYGWKFSVNAICWFRIRCTAYTASGSAKFILAGTPFASDPVPGIGAHSVANTAAIFANPTITAESVTNLGVSGVFTGAAKDAGTPACAFSDFVVNAYADQAGSFVIQKSTDNVTWRPASPVISVLAGVPIEASVTVTTRYSRVVYTNGAVAQTAFMLTSSLKRI